MMMILKLLFAYCISLVEMIECFVQCEYIALDQTCQC